MQQEPVILFFKIGGFSNINDSVQRQLAKHFPDNEIVSVDVPQLARKEIHSFENWLCLLQEYGSDFMLRRKNFRSAEEWLFVTSRAYLAIKNKLSAFAGNRNIRFTFQTQSMFDGKLPGIPHFVYSDSTVLANYQYPDIAPESFLKSEKWMKQEPEIYKNADINFVFSSNQQRSLTEQYGIHAERIVCVYGGSNAAFNYEPEYGKHYHDKNILFVGVNWERKGGPVLLEAFLRSLKLHPDATLTIAGCAPDVRHKNIQVLGKISLDEVDKAYSRASLFSMPTRQEPFGIAFIEAMHRKLPIISSNIGALPDMVTNGVNGFLLPPDDVNGICQALLKLLNSPQLCETMGMNGKKIADEKYRWDNTGEIISENIKRVLNKET